MILLSGCADRPPSDAALGPTEAARVLSRASLDLRGVRPSEEDLLRAMGDPLALDALVAAYGRDERFEDRVREWMAPAWLTRTEAELVDSFSFDLSVDQRAKLVRSAGEEPLRVVARIAAEDLPVEEMVLGDWTMVDHTLASLWPVRTSDGPGWRTATWTDGRPAAGALATTGTWWRYDSNEANANRKRANAVSRILLCDDYLARPVDFDRTAGQLSDDFEERTQEDPNCATCHATLDPLASYLYGFWFYAYGGPDVLTYHPERERTWADVTGVAPAYFGSPGSSLADLGAEIARDPRFERCAAQRVAEPLLRRTVEEAELDGFEDALRGGGTLRSAVEAVLASEAYRSPSEARLPDPALLGTAIAHLTGFAWEEDGVDLMTSDVDGYLTLAGGVDGYNATRPAEVPSVTILLVHQRLAEAAADHAVEATLAHPGSVPLLDRLDLAWTPETDREAMADVLSHAMLRALARPATTADVEAALDLWSELLAIEGDARAAWVGVLSAVLRDPDFLLY